MDLKQKAMAKKAFIQSDFGKIAAQDINAIYARYLEKSQASDLKPYEKAYLIERAAAISEVISYFTSDVVLLESGAFEEKEDKKKA